MQRVSVWYHQDGDHLVVSEVPWWKMGAEWAADTFFCPCCGITGFLSRWEKPGAVIYRVWNALLEVGHKHEKTLVKVPVDGCEISKALWPDEEHSCWNCDPEEEDGTGENSPVEEPGGSSSSETRVSETVQDQRQNLS